MRGMKAIMLGLMICLSACSALRGGGGEPLISTQLTSGAAGLSVRPGKFNRIMLPVMVNDQGPFNFLFDTGATCTVLSEQLAGRLTLSLTELPTVNVRGVTGLFTAPAVRVASVQTGELHLKELRATVLAGPVMQSVDGILGMQGLGDKKIIADFVQQSVQLIAADGAPSDERHAVVPFATLARRFMSVDAKVDGVKVTAVIDTGGSQTLGNQALLSMLLRRSHGQSLKGYLSSLVDSSADSHATVLLPMSRVALGAVEFPRLSVSFGDFSVFKVWGLQNEPALLLGMDALGMLSELTIDYRRGELQMLRR